MNKEFLDYVQTLSLRDKKTLSQKALKLTEEIGELARVILPYDGAYGTNHRFAEPDDILEESMDSILCCLSIAYHLGYTHDDIDAMIMKKAEKWAKLQANEDKAQFPLPYEIHVTVKANDRPWNTIKVFEAVCKDIGVKSIVLDLQRDSSIILTDVMTSSKHFGDNKSAYLEAQRISRQLEQGGWETVRIKIETVPWHPAAPQTSDDYEKMPKDCYFEAHIPVNLLEAHKPALVKYVETFSSGKLHLSQNVLKRYDDGTITVMVTFREYKGWAQKFQHEAETLPGHLLLNVDFPSVKIDGKVITEFSIYDTKVSHDANWILGNGRTDTRSFQDA